MSMNPPLITSVSFNATIEKSSVAPILEQFPVSIPIKFSNVQNLYINTGSYTPNNDYLYVMQGIIASKSPNFMIIVVDSPIAIAVQFAKSNMNYSPTKFGFLEWASDPLNLVSGFFIDGRTSPNPGNTPMSQGVLANYTIITGQSQIG